MSGNIIDTNQAAILPPGLKIHPVNRSYTGQIDVNSQGHQCTSYTGVLGVAKLTLFCCSGKPMEMQMPCPGKINAGWLKLLWPPPRAGGGDVRQTRGKG